MIRRVLAALIWAAWWAVIAWDIYRNARRVTTP